MIPWLFLIAMAALLTLSAEGADQRQMGLSQFLVDLSTPGIRIRPIADLTGPRPHGQAVERREAHRALDAPPALERAHRGTAAEMGDNAAPCGRSGCQLAKPLLTPGEVMQLPASDELVLISGLAPIRAKKLRYFEDRNFTDRILPAPNPATLHRSPVADDWGGQVRVTDPRLAAALAQGQG